MMNEEEKIRRARRILGLGRMSLSTVHDVNNQLTVLSMHADNLLERFEEGGADPEVRKALQQIAGGIGRITALLSHFPRFSNAGEKIVEPLDLNACVEQACRYFLKAPGAGQAKIKLTKVLAADAPYIRADRIDVFNALAECASGMPASISIRTYVDGEQACVEMTVDGGKPSTVAFERLSEAETALIAAA